MSETYATNPETPPPVPFDIATDEAAVAYRGWSPAGLVALYEMLQRDYPFPQHLYPLALALCDWRITNLMMIAGPGSGKSTLTSQVFPGAVLGRNPTENVMCVSGAEELAQGFQHVVMSYIQEHEGFKRYFPDVKPDKARGWSANSGMFVTGRRISSPDANFWSAGIESRAITGKHGTVLIFDDLHTEKNSSTDAQCQNVVDTYVRQLSGRQDPRGARYIVTGRRWHERDLYGTLKDSGDWVVLTLPYERPGSKLLWYDITLRDGFKCVFTDGMSKSPDGTLIVGYEGKPEKLEHKIETKENGTVLRHIKWPYGIDPSGEGFFWPDSDAKRREYFSNKRLQPAATEAVYQCNPSVKQGTVFVDSDFDRRYEPIPYQELGIQVPAVADLCQRDGATLIQAWDTAFSSNASSDHSACVTLLLHPCTAYHKGEDPERFGPCERHFDIAVLDVWRGRVDYAGVERQMRSMYQLWQPSLVVIENKAYGVTAIENLQMAGMPIEAVTPGILESKRARAVEGVAGGSVQGWCRSWRIRLPTEAPWVEQFLLELKDFTGRPGGVDDQVDAFVHGVRWAIRNGGGTSLPKGWGTPVDIDRMMMGVPIENNLQAMMSGFQGRDYSPIEERCGNCRNYAANRGKFNRLEIMNVPHNFCVLHKRPTLSIGYCDNFSDAHEAIEHPFWSTE